MTTPDPRRRSLDRGQVGAGALAGLVHGVSLALLVLAFAWYSLGGWPESAQTIGGWALLVLAVLLLAGSWLAGTALLRRRGLRRARSITSCSLALSTVAVTILSIAAGWLAIVIGVFSALVLWTGEYAEPLAFTAVAVVVLMGLLIATSTSLLFTAVFATPTD